jgi:WD40 repeat protein
VSPRTVSDLERGINRTAHKDTAVLLANALSLTGPVRELFVAAARGRAPAAEVLAAIDAGGIVRVLNPVSGKAAGPSFHAGLEGAHLYGVERVAFSPDSKLLASNGWHGTVRVWNPVTGKPLGAPIPAVTGPYAGVFDVAFSPDGKLLATADSDGTVELWNPVTGKLAGAPLETGALGGVLAVAFSRDGNWLASAGSDGAIQRWRMPLLRHPYAALCADVGPPTPQDWAKYAPGEPQPKICAPAQNR